MRKQFVKYAVLSLVLLMVGCAKKPEYAKVIPSDAEIVATFDCQRLLNESGLLSTGGDESKNQFIESIKNHLSAGETELFEQILANPNEVGIDWSQKVYGFKSERPAVLSFVFPVINVEKLKASLLTFAGSKIRGRKFVEEDGYFWANGRNFYVAVNDQTCMLIVENASQKLDELKQQVSLWMKQSLDESFISSKYHQMLTDVDGEIGVYSSLESLPENISMMASLAYSEDMDISSIKYLADISVEKGKIVADGKILYEDSKMREWILKQEDACKKLDAKSLAYLPKNTPLWFGVGIDGNDLFDLLLEHPSYGKQLQNMSLPLDIEGVIRSIDGDLAISYPNGLLVDVKNDEILRICVGAIKTMGRLVGLNLNEVEKNQYELVDENHRVKQWLNIDAELSMGMYDDSFYLLTNSNGIKKLSDEESLLSAEWADEVDNNMCFLAFNFHNENNIVDKYVSSRKKSKAIQDYFSYFTYSQKNIENNTIVLSFIDQQRNVVEQLIEFYFKLY